MDPSRLVFFDGCGASTAINRTHGRGPSGVRVDGPVPHGHRKVVTLTAAVRLDGVAACLAFDGAADAATFETYVERCLGPTPRPGDTVVMDNPSCQRTSEVERLVSAAGGRVRSLAAYSPDLNPRSSGASASSRSS